MRLHIRGLQPVLIQCKSSLMTGCVALGLLFVNSVNALPASNTSSAALLSEQDLQKLKTAQQKIIAKDYRQALKLAGSVLSEVPAQFEAKFIRAQALSRLGKIKEAIEIYQSLLAARPKQPGIYNNLATLYARQGKLDLARETLDKGMATNPQYKILYENLSAIYVEMARGAYSKALKLGVQAKAVQLKTLNLAVMPVIAAADKKSASNILLANSVSVQNKPKLEDKHVPDKLAMLQQPAVIKEPIRQKTARQELKPKKSNKNKTATVSVPVNKEEVVTALQGWAAAWSAQAVDLYLSFYGKDFKPVKLPRKVWEVQRRMRISKPRWVNVRLNDFDIRPQQQNKVIVQLVQDYQADNYRDKTRKQFVMQHTIDGWRILSEKSLAVLR